VKVVARVLKKVVPSVEMLVAERVDGLVEKLVKVTVDEMEYPMGN